MPFGPYTDHADCVAKNQDKRDPDAYCAAIEQAITGKMALPTQKQLRPIKPIITIPRQKHADMRLL